MKSNSEMRDMFCPLINRKCEGPACVSCKEVYTKPADYEVFSHYECENPECKKRIEKKAEGSHHPEYCLSCGSGRPGEEYGLKSVMRTISATQTQSLYVCTYFDTPEEKMHRENILMLPAYGGKLS